MSEKITSREAIASKKYCLEFLGPAKMWVHRYFGSKISFWPKIFFGSEKLFGSMMLCSVQQNFGSEIFLSRKTLSIKAFKSEKSLGQKLFFATGGQG